VIVRKKKIPAYKMECSMSFEGTRRARGS
jgi:hypothetical protein